MNKAISAGVFVLCLMMLFSTSPLGAQEWNYPKPDPNRDVKDISFYEAGDGQPLPAIKADRPRRIILCIGDGMGFAQASLARQRAMGAAGRLHFERLPVSGSVRTYSANHIVTDSAAAATAMACGVKTNNGMIGMTPDKQPRQTLLELLDRKGWRTGLSVTCTLSHATPAGFASHAEDRGMEAEIAAQLLAGPVDVMFGGGRAYWTNAEGTKRKDGRDLIAEAQQGGCQLIYSRQQMPCLATGVRTVGLFADAEMTTFSPEPTLAEMTQKAIELLNAKSDEWFAPRPKFFLMVEGSQIDWACHDNNEDNMVRQLLLFDMAPATDTRWLL
jgi:alkaline phosphatase